MKAFVQKLYDRIGITSARDLFKGRRAFLWAGGAALLVMFFFLLRAPAERVEVQKVRNGTYEQSIMVEAVTQVRDRYVVLAPVSGVLERITLRSGDTVTAGQPVANIRWEFLKPVPAPATGRVLRILREFAGPVEMGTPLLEIGDIRKLEIEAQVLTRDAVAVAPGNPVEVTDWGGEPLNAEVYRVEPGANTRLSALGVEEQRAHVVIRFKDTLPEALGDNYRVNCRIITVRKEAATIVPAGALFRTGKDWAVFRDDGGRARLTPVVVEMRGADDALVQSGLKAGDSVIVYPGETIVDGIRIQPYR